MIEHAVRGDLSQHDAIGNTQQRITVTALQMIHQLMHHHIDRGQGLDQIDHQGFGRGPGVDAEQRADGSRGGFDVGGLGEVVSEGTLGGFVEFF